MEHEIHKIPDSVLLKISRQEVGRLKSEIDEHEYQIEILQTAIAARDSLIKERDKKINELNEKLKQAHKDAKSTQGYKILKKQNRKLRVKIKSLREQFNEYISMTKY